MVLHEWVVAPLPETSVVGIEIGYEVLHVLVAKALALPRVVYRPLADIVAMAGNDGIE